MASRPVADAVELESLDDEAQPTNYALKLTEALEAIAAAQPGYTAPAAAPVGPAAPAASAIRLAQAPAALAAFAEVLAAAEERTVAPVASADPAVTVELSSARAAAPATPAAAIVSPAAPAAPAAATPAPAMEPAAFADVLAAVDADAVDEVDAPALTSPSQNRVAAFLEALDKLPPIKLPIGPAIPWRLGLPMLIAALVLSLVMFRPAATAPADQPGVKLPTQETYAVQQSPLFAKPASSTDQPVAQQPAPIGVQEPAAASVDVFDLAIKFIAVLGLACGSLFLLKRFGPGGNGVLRSDPNSGVRVVSSLVLAPNRTVHVLRTPDGKSLLLGATPNQVNLIADLGELSEDALTAQGSTFFDVLATKLAKAA